MRQHYNDDRLSDRAPLLALCVEKAQRDSSRGNAGMESAIQREKQLKEWKRIWKMRSIESTNPNWEDLYHTLA